MAAKLITGPKSEPISLDEAKRHLNLNDDITAFDDAIDGLIVTAREAAESHIRRALMPQTWELALDSFPREIELVRPPLISIVSVQYADASGVMQTLPDDAYMLDDFSEPARLLPAYGTSWPSARAQRNAVRVRYIAGYANAGAVPRKIKQWMLLQIGTWHENKESVVAGISIAELPHVDRLLGEFKIWNL